MNRSNPPARPPLKYKVQEVFDMENINLRFLIKIIKIKTLIKTTLTITTLTTIINKITVLFNIIIKMILEMTFNLREVKSISIYMTIEFKIKSKIKLSIIKYLNLEILVIL
jgi:hypothetical protein